MSAIDRAAIDLVLSRSEAGPVARRLLMQRTTKGHKKSLRSGIPGHSEMAVKAVKQDPELRFKLCCARMTLGHYGDWDGWQFRGLPEAEWAANLWENQPLGPPWDGKPTKKLYLLGEQGVGDEVLFSQCIPDAIEALGHRNIVLDTDPRLISIFERSFGIECVPRMKISDPRPGMTSWMGLADLGRLFRTGKFNGRPYLRPDQRRDSEARWAAGKQAVAWRGRQGTYPVDEFVKAVGTGIDVQYDGSSDLLEQAGFDKRDDLEGLLGLLANVRRLVSVSTSVAHLAAAIGVPVDLILAPPKSGRAYDQLPWRWGMGNRTPWYDSVRIHRNLREYLSTSRKESRCTSTLVRPPQS